MSAGGFSPSLRWLAEGSASGGSGITEGGGWTRVGCIWNQGGPSGTGEVHSCSDGVRQMRAGVDGRGWGREGQCPYSPEARAPTAGQRAVCSIFGYFYIPIVY